MDLLERRIAERQARARARAATLRAKAAEAASFLRARGATRVVLFGSLVTGAEPHEGTDVDIAVFGMSFDAVLEAALDLERLFGAHVDLVRGEDASPSIFARLARDGVDL